MRWLLLVALAVGRPVDRPPPLRVHGPCHPTTCAAHGFTCGALSDGCGSTLDCGSCTFPDVCLSNTCSNGYTPGAPVPLAIQCTGDAIPSTFAGQAVTFARTSSAYCSKSDGNLVLLTSNKPRLEQNGVLIEGPRSNDVTDPRDLSTANWTRSNMTAAHTAAGADGTANGATTITASAANATVKQTITAASAARSTSFMLKRRTGTGSVFVTNDDGANWDDVTADVNALSWVRTRQQCTDNIANNPVHYMPACSEATHARRTAANQIIGIKLATSGDAVDVDFVQNELGGYTTSPVVGFSRDEDVLQLTDLASLPTSQGEMLIDWSTQVVYGFSSDITAVIDTGSFNALGGAKGLGMYVDGANGNAADELISSATGMSILTPLDYPGFAGLQLDTRFSWGSGKWYVWHDGILYASIADGSANMPNGHLQGYIGAVNTDSPAAPREAMQGWVSRVRFTSGAVTTFSGAQGVLALGGDSIVQGTLVAADYKPHVEMQALLGGRVSEKYVSTAAAAGYTVDQCKTAWDSEVSAIYNSGSAARAHSHLLLQCGINSLADGAGSVWGKLNAMLGSAQDAGIDVIPATITPCGICNTATINSINASIRSWCSQNNERVADTFAALTNGSDALQSQYSIDGEHPNALGSTVMVNVWCDAGACF